MAKKRSSSKQGKKGLGKPSSKPPRHSGQMWQDAYQQGRIPNPMTGQHKPGTTPPPGPPKVPAPPVPTDPRIDALYSDETTGLRTEYGNSLTDITFDENKTAGRYGFVIGRDAQGNATFNSANPAVDPADPFSKMSLLQRSYEQAKTGTTNSMAAQGHLYSGSLRNAQTENTYQMDLGKNSLISEFQDYIEQSTRGRRAAGTDYSAGVANAAGRRLDRQLGG